VPSIEQVLNQLEKQRSGSLKGLVEFLSIASVSADPDRSNDVAACARWLAERFGECGLEVSVEETAGHPVVLAQSEFRSDRPTALVYGHYDVQPVDPIGQWVTPPFEPTVRKTPANTDALYARGAADDKGQIWSHVQAVAAWQALGGLPINLIFLIEGEEEIDSHHLPTFLESHRDKLRADIAIVSDTNCFARGVPAITTGLRGLVYSEVTLRVAENDLHSGIHGGAVMNPALGLARLLSKLHDEENRVTLNGFYDEVLPLSDAARESWEGLPFDQAGYVKNLGLRGGEQSLSGEAGYSTVERRWARPTCDVCGLTSGYQGAGAKTIIPASATAKVSFRLVPNQDPLAVQYALMEFVGQNCPAGLTAEVIHFAGAPAVSVPSEGPWVQAAVAAVKRGFGVEPVLIREGLTIPIVNLLRQRVGLDTLLVGFGLPDDNPHSPNEKFDLDCLHAGARTAAALYGLLAKIRL
jgi:acetylornithine deacetylase/succinyl-diaminopimelate desuccinylase-like protein